MVWNTLPIRGASNPKGLRASMRPKGENVVLVTSRKPDDPLLSRGFCWSGRRDSNPRPSPWQGMPTCSTDLHKRPETASGLQFWLITGSR